MVKCLKIEDMIIVFNYLRQNIFLNNQEIDNFIESIDLPSVDVLCTGQVFIFLF